MDMREIITEWTTDAGSGYLSVMYFDATLAVASQRAAISNLFGGLDANLNNGTSWSVRSSGRELDDATGTLTGVWTASGSVTGVGAGAVNPVPDAAMVLCQWQTGAIVLGRMVKGRTFVPGLEQSAVVNGELTGGGITAMEVFTNNFIAAGVGFGVWHRPGPGGAGSFHVAAGSSVWKELAVLRRRRG